MSKEESLKKVELKVHVNCCDGCKKKILKALNIKGVLKTEIHPTLPRVTVTGTVEVGVLIKKLSKCGKHSELVQIDNIPQPAEKELKKTSDIIKEDSKVKKNEVTVPARFVLPEAFGVPAPCYSNWARQQCCNYGVPAVYQNCMQAMVAVTSPEGAGMAEYFNDENTMGCHVM